MWTSPPPPLVAGILQMKASVGLWGANSSDGKKIIMEIKLACQSGTHINIEENPFLVLADRPKNECGMDVSITHPFSRHPSGTLGENHGEVRFAVRKSCGFCPSEQ